MTAMPGRPLARVVAALVVGCVCVAGDAARATEPTNDAAAAHAVVRINSRRVGDMCFFPKIISAYARNATHHGRDASVVPRWPSAVASDLRIGRSRYTRRPKRGR